MGNIAQDMARLADDIIRLKAERVEKIADIAAKTVEIRVETNSMLDEFAQTRKVQAEFDKSERVSFVTNLVADVGEMLDVFQESHRETAITEAAKRQQSVKNIKQEVHHQLDNFADEMSEMRSAWQGRKTIKKAVRATANSTVKVAGGVAPTTGKIQGSDLLSVLADEFGTEMKQSPADSKTNGRRRRR